MVLKSCLIKDALCDFILMVLLHNSEMGIVHLSPTSSPLTSLAFLQGNTWYCTCDGVFRAVVPG